MGEMRGEFGKETARVILGHLFASNTTVYAKKNQQEAIEATRKAG